MAAALMFWSMKICVVCLCLTSVVGIDSNVSNGGTLGFSQSLRYGQTLVSGNGRFELGFFKVSPRRDSSAQDLQYLGIWYKGIEPLTVIWVGNRDKPLRGNALRLFITPFGNLIVRDDQGTEICLVRSNQTVTRPLVALENSGNLVVKDGEGKSDYIWQSFDFPSDTLLPGMKLGWDLKAGRHRFLTSWRTSEDPCWGDFLFGMDSPNSPQLVLQKNGATQSRWGPWNGNRFSGTNIKDNQVFRTVYHSSPDEIYFAIQMLDDSILLRLVLNSNGAVQFLKWKPNYKGWVPMVTLNRDACERYGSCGPYGVCHASDDSGCQCLKGFVENSPSDWRRLDCTDGCRRSQALNCSGGDGFQKFTGLKLPNNFTVLQGSSPNECLDYCLKKCNCMAYTNLNVYGNGSQCVVWMDKLIDMRDFGSEGDELNIRLARGEIESLNHRKRKWNIIISCIAVASVIVGVILWLVTRKCRLACYRACYRGITGLISREHASVQSEDPHNVRIYSMSTISAATNGFSMENTVGQGGFGTVYEGELPDGQKVAVKRLSKNSNQGVEEFKNEVHTIAQLQHRNLVRLLGCSVEGNERMLVYEFMPNKSLDQFIFNPERKHLLPWEKRVSIIKGIARGLDYLHFGSRLRIIHRDLKASNVLLDEDMDPKISDFGLARNCEHVDEDMPRTRVIGTYGYMSPEYVIGGHYSTKSDVFSFGVLAVEIIGGQRNWGFQHPDHEYNLLGHAWKLWTERRELELVDPVLEGSVVEAEAIRFIHIGLLCAQHSSEERPTMPQVVAMLENDNIALPEPSEPGFFTQRSSAGNAGMNISGWSQDSVNWLTVTSVSARE